MSRPNSLPRQPAKWISLILAIAVHGGLILFLFFGVQWQRKPAEAVSVELVSAPPPSAQTRPAPTPEPPKPPAEPPKPQPAPKPVEPEKTEPKPVTKPDIAVKPPEKPKRKPEPKQEPKPEPEPKPKPVEPKPKPRQQATTEQSAPKPSLSQDQLRQQAEERNRRLLNQEADRSVRDRQQALLQQDANRRADANASAQLNGVRGDWASKIQSKVRSNIVLPPSVTGRPIAQFKIKLLPSGEVMSAQLVSSSGNKALDDAIERAIHKSSPLPKPSDSKAFESDLTLKFDPLGD